MATHSAGSNSKDTSQTVQRANTTVAPQAASSAASVKAASPTTSVSSHVAGSNTNDMQGAQTGNRGTSSAAPATGIAAAASMSGASTGNRGNQQTASIVDQTPQSSKADWNMLQDQIDALPQRSSSSALSLPGDRTEWNDFLQNINNGSLGVPRAAGYGKTFDPNAPIGFDPMAQDTAAMNKSLAASPPGAGIDIASVLHSLNGPYLERLKQNGGVPPFEGPVDTGGMIRSLNAPYYRSVATPGPMNATGIGPSAAEFASLLGTPDSSMASNDRLPAERRVPTSVVIPAYAPTNPGETARTLNADGTTSDPLTAIADATSGIGLPRRDPRGYSDPLFSTDGQVTTTDGTMVRPGVPASSDGTMQPGYNGGVTGSPGAKQSGFDRMIDGASHIVEKTGYGAAIKKLFPDFWNGFGDVMHGLDNGTGGGHVNTPIYNPADDTEIADRTHSSRTGGGLLDFIDANGNGIDDRYEGIAPAAGGIATAANTDATGYSGNQFRSNRYATFPDMPPYRPGVDNEWNYFHDHLARGGVVGYSDRDPRVGMIADAEDALHRGDHQHASITQFIDTFGPKALEHLNTNVLAGHRMRAGMPGRTVVGPGGPTDDAVPAVIDGQHPAKLSSGEFVVPVAAVEGIGDGDPRVGADRLHALVSRFAAK